MSFAELLRRTADYARESMMAGFGPISDGIPEKIGNGGDSERKMPGAPRCSRPLYDTDKTAPMRKARP